tara:strand:- start:600 stop:1673 length:1074 start_codon:yes stop_codon:yes gene_type:complete
MKKKSLNAKKIIHKNLLNKLKNPKIKSVYKNFEKLLIDNGLKKNVAVGVSGGSDSLGLTFLAKCYSILNKSTVKYYHVNHRLRVNSNEEAKLLVSKLKKFDINCKILTWRGKKPKSNIQSIARKNRYKLFFKECLKDNIQSLLIAHHTEDLYESFIIRLLRGSGLKGLTSFNNLNRLYQNNSNITIFRPLINLNKKKLNYITNNVFKFHFRDPSNKNNLFKRIRIRNLIKILKREGLDENKLKMTINNLAKSNFAINYYVKKNIKLNSKFFTNKNRKLCIIKEDFFNQPDEVIFRSLSDILNNIGNKYYPARGKSIIKILEKIESKNLYKVTLSGCIIEKLNNSLLIYEEKAKKSKK